MNPETTIRLTRETVSELGKLKVHPRQSYEEVISFIAKDKKKPDFSKFVKKNSFTTIQVSKNLVNKLSNLKIHPRQGYEEIMQALLK